MCPLWPFHYLLVYLVLFASVFYIAVGSTAINCKYWNVTFYPSRINSAQIDQAAKVDFNVTLVDCRSSITVRPVCSHILSCWPSSIQVPPDLSETEKTRYFSSSFNVTPTFMGYGDVKIDLSIRRKYSYSYSYSLSTRFRSKFSVFPVTYFDIVITSTRLTAIIIICSFYRRRKPGR